MPFSWKILFESDGATPPLFRSQRELARILCAHRGFGEEKLASIATFLNQILLGRRPLPQEWKRQLRIVIERRAREQGMNEMRLFALFASLEQLFSATASDINELVAAQAVARDTLILNACPLELSDAKRVHAEAALLQNLVLTALEDERSYHYCVASQTSAQRLWRALLHAADEKYKGKTAERVRVWTEKHLLTISTVPGLLLLHPTVAYNTSAPDRLQIFIWHAPYDWEHTLVLPTQQTGAWLEKVQYVLETESQTIPLQS